MSLRLKRSSSRKPLPEIPASIKDRVEDVVRATMRRAEIELGYKPLRFPNIEYTLRGTTAGTAHSGKWEININPVLLIENIEDMLDQTIPHEVAHLIADRVYGHTIKPHGKEWKSVMVALGKRPDRCHSYDVANARVRQKSRYRYTCKCDQGVHCGPTVHNRVQNNRSEHRCKRCKTLLRQCSFERIR